MSKDFKKGLGSLFGADKPKSGDSSVAKLLDPVAVKDKPSKPTTPRVYKKESKTVSNSESLPLPKWEQLLKMNFLLTDDQKSQLDKLTRKIMKSRPKGDRPSRERITNNTIMRALIDSLFTHIPKLDIREIDNEEELRQRILNLFKDK